MQQDIRQLAKRHMWLSWWWGMVLVWAMGLVWLVHLWVTSYNSAFPSNELFAQTGYSLLWGALGSIFFLGLPALLGAFARRPIMPHVFGRATSLAGLLWRTALVFEGSVFVCWLIWEVYTWLFNPISIRVLPRQHFVSTTLTFFGLSLPWLLSSVAAAWWLNRGRWRAVETGEKPAVSN